MTPDSQTDLSGLDPAERVRALTQRGIAQAGAGEGIAAVVSLKEAEQIALDAGLTSLAIGAHIDRGWALWQAGEIEGAIVLYAEAAEQARTAGDAERLRLALGNLGMGYARVGRYAEALAAYEEHLPLVADDPAEAADAHLNAGSVFVSLGRPEDAEIHFADAERLAEGAGLIEPRVVVNLNRGVLVERSGDTDAAFALYWKAFDLAEEAQDADLVGRTTLILGRAYTRAGDHEHAADCFNEAVRAFRYLEEPSRIAEALHLRGDALQQVGLLDAAVDAWEEEESILRELGSTLALAECLLRKALVQGAQSWGPAVDLLLGEAAQLFRIAASTGRLASVYQSHAQMLRDNHDDEQAGELLDRAFGCLEESPDPHVESRARGLRALVLADAGEAEAAASELDAAEAIAGAAGDPQAITGLRARRAYVLAREGKPAGEVIAQLEAALDHAKTLDLPEAGEQAVRLVAAEIGARCGEEYRDALGSWQATADADPEAGAEPV